MTTTLRDKLENSVEGLCLLLAGLVFDIGDRVLDRRDLLGILIGDVDVEAPLQTP